MTPDVVVDQASVTVGRQSSQIFRPGGQVDKWANLQTSQKVHTDSHSAPTASRFRQPDKTPPVEVLPVSTLPARPLRGQEGPGIRSPLSSADLVRWGLICRASFLLLAYQIGD